MTDNRDALAQAIHDHACIHSGDVGDCEDADFYREDAEALLPVVARIKAEAKAEALREFADSRGVNVGDDDSEWWQGYRQAQRECLHDAIDQARAEASGEGA